MPVGYASPQYPVLPAPSPDDPGAGEVVTWAVAAAVLADLLVAHRLVAPAGVGA